MGYTFNPFTNTFDVTSGGSSSGPLTVEYDLSPEEMADIIDTPVELIAAPGANKVIMVQGGTMQSTASDVPFEGHPGLLLVVGDEEVVDTAPLSLATHRAFITNTNPTVAGNISVADTTNQPLLVTSTGDPSDIHPFGGIDTTTLDDTGSLYAVGDVALIAASSGDIDAVNQGTKTFTLDDSISFNFHTKLVVKGSTGNNGSYTIASINTVARQIVVVEAIPSPIADGTAYYGTATITVDTVDNAFPITGYSAGNTYAVTAVAADPVNTFTIAGDHAAEFATGRLFYVTGSTGNDNAYKVLSSAFGASTVVTIDSGYSIIPDATADGSLRIGQSITVAGDRTGDFTPEASAYVYRSTGDNGTHPIGSVVFTTSTAIEILEELSGPTSDGQIGQGSDPGAVGSLDTYTISTPGIYAVDSYTLYTNTTGADAILSVDTLASLLTDIQVRIRLRYEILSLLT